jgi:Aspartyl/Asparaginyl beta-hydroxylase
MRYFHKVAEGICMAPLALSLARKPWLWNANTFRTTYPKTPFGDCDDIFLRFDDVEKCGTQTDAIGGDHTQWYPAVHELPEVKPLVLDLMRGVGGHEIKRLLITRLRPGKSFLPHSDKDGSYVHTKNMARYHMVLQGLPGSLFTCGDETVCMRTGEVWWFNAHELHSGVNNSADDRIHILADIVHWP